MGQKNQSRGLYQKYEVYRTDGSSAEGEKHHGCEYFVLDLNHDEYAVAALKAYADACRNKYPKLAEDLDDRRRAMMLRDVSIPEWE